MPAHGYDASVVIGLLISEAWSGQARGSDLSLDEIGAVLASHANTPGLAL